MTLIYCETESSVAEFPSICRDRMTLLKITFMSSDDYHLSETQFGLAVFSSSCRDRMSLF
jgi:hypothetical protein